jgi:CheY-like chemotaxis protein
MSNYRFDRLRVLVVDDNQHMRKLVATILHGFGTVHVYEAARAERAWDMLHDCNPDVILLDWIMEGMSGLELAQRIRTSPQSPNPLVSIIMLTGHTHIDRVRQARDVGINEFLAKPVSVKSLLTRLSAVIENPRPFVRTEEYFGPCRRRRNYAEYQGPERRTKLPLAAKLAEPDAA